MINRIIVLGGSGFLGSHIIRALQKAQIGEVTCGDLIPNSELNCKYIKLDILDVNDICKKLDNYDTIINCTGQITRPFNLCFKLNSIGISNLVKALLAKTVRLIHISSVAVYGSVELCNEESPLNPETNYATAKACAEQNLLGNYDYRHLVILRLSNLYGNNQMKGVFEYLMRSYHSDQKLNFNNDGTLTRSFMHVEDCADIIAKVIKNNMLNGIYNVKGNETYTIKKLIQKFEKRFNICFEKSFSEDSPWENIDYLDDNKLKKHINLEPNWTLFKYIEELEGHKG